MTRFTNHAEEMIQERSIRREWIEDTISSPDYTKPDSRPGVTRSFKAVALAGDRTLRVAHRPEGTEVLVITAHFDKGARR